LSKFQQWRKRPDRSRSRSPNTGRKRPSILQSLEMIDKFCDDFNLDEDIEYKLKHNVGPDDAIRTITDSKLLCEMKKNASPGVVVQNMIKRHLINKDDGRVVSPEDVCEQVEKLSFLEISQRLCKFIKLGKVDRDTEELLLSRVSVKDAVDLVSATTLQRVRNPSALVQSKLKQQSMQVDPYANEEAWAVVDDFVYNRRPAIGDQVRRKTVRIRHDLAGIDSNGNSKNRCRIVPKDFIGRADKSRAAGDPYSRFSGQGGVSPAVGPSINIPPGLMKKAKLKVNPVIAKKQGVAALPAPATPAPPPGAPVRNVSPTTILPHQVHHNAGFTVVNGALQPPLPREKPPPLGDEHVAHLRHQDIYGVLGEMQTQPNPRFRIQPDGGLHAQSIDIHVQL